MMPDQPPLTILACTGHAWSTPLATLRLASPIQRAGMRLIQTPPWEPVSPETLAATDLVVVQREYAAGAQYTEVARQARAARKPLIFEIDDLLFDLPSDHPDREYYAPLIEPMRQALVAADAVTVSTQLLADSLRGLNPRVWVLPNFLDDGLWSMTPPRLMPDGPLVVGYMGSDSHRPDLEPLVPVLQRLLEKYGSRIHCRFLGIQPPQLLAAYPGVVCAPFEAQGYDHFAKRFALEGYMVAIAPLSDNHFNHCKSAIKYLEYSACGAAGVYGRVSPYAALVEHGHNGFLAATPDEWEACLTWLIENASGRYQMALAAQETLRQAWLLSRNACRWVEAYQAIAAAGCREPVLAATDREAIAPYHRLFRRLRHWLRRT